VRLVRCLPRSTARLSSLPLLALELKVVVSQGQVRVWAIELGEDTGSRIERK
jgi:hypothetical protein